MSGQKTLLSSNSVARERMFEVNFELKCKLPEALLMFLKTITSRAGEKTGEKGWRGRGEVWWGRAGRGGRGEGRVVGETGRGWRR